MQKQIHNALPIGVFDSGMGGLTVLDALTHLMPNENYIYLGDTARLPYGTKSKETVSLYAHNASAHLIDRGIKLLVVACNTASSVALDTLRKQFAPIPVIGVIEPGAKTALELLDSGPIVVIATEGTVQSKAYSQAILKSDPLRQVIEWPCSLLVALAEEGWHQGPIVEDILNKMLDQVLAQIAQYPQAALLLGCTHFPVLKPAIEKVVNENTMVIDSALSVAKAVFQLLDRADSLNPQSSKGNIQYLVTDGIERFQRVGKFFLNPKNRIDLLEMIALDAVNLPIAKVNFPSN